MPIINFAPTGMIPTKNDNPYLPVTPIEIIQCITELSSYISMVHLHVRSEYGTPTNDKDTYKYVIKYIREYNNDLIICGSTSGRTLNTIENRASVLSCDVDMASLTLGSINFHKDVSYNTPEMIIELAKRMKEKGIKPELEVFDTGMINFAHYLIKKNIITPPYYFNLILGGPSTAQPNRDLIRYMLSIIPENSYVSLGGIGKYTYETHKLAKEFNLGIRIGLEDTIWNKQGEICSNKTLLLDTLKEFNMSPIDSKTLRKSLCLFKAS